MRADLLGQMVQLAEHGAERSVSSHNLVQFESLAGSGHSEKLGKTYSSFSHHDSRRAGKRSENLPPPRDCKGDNGRKPLVLGTGKGGPRKNPSQDTALRDQPFHFLRGQERSRHDLWYSVRLRAGVFT